MRSRPVKDRFGVELEVGHAIVYATKSGSSPRLEDAVVQRVFPDKVKVGKFHKWFSPNPGPYEGWNVNQRSVYLRYSERIISVGEDNVEDLADRS